MVIVPTLRRQAIVYHPFLHDDIHFPGSPKSIEVGIYSKECFQTVDNTVIHHPSSTVYGPLRMSQDWTRLVGFFEPFDLVFAEFYIQRGDGLVEMIHLGGANDRGGNIRLVQQPG
jgi:hypothetical protein